MEEKIEDHTDVLENKIKERDQLLRRIYDWGMSEKNYDELGVWLRKQGLL